jgi:methylmalonic aciduria homocystinuria type C protein
VREQHAVQRGRRGDELVVEARGHAASGTVARLPRVWHRSRVAAAHDDLHAELARLAARGLDVAQVFDARAVADAVALPWLGDPARPVGVMIGNTRALWPALRAARAADRELRASDDPVQLYVERAVDAVARALGGARARVWYSHRRYAGAFVPFQRVAVAAGLGAMTAAQLVVHPTYGPWFALRAIVTLPGVPPAGAAPIDDTDLARDVTRNVTPDATRAGADDDAMAAALARALAARGPDAWRAWLAVRDACPIGRAYRYGDAQIRYHYTKDRDALDEIDGDGGDGGDGAGEISTGDGDRALR